MLVFMVDIDVTSITADFKPPDVRDGKSVQNINANMLSLSAVKRPVMYDG